MAGGRLPWGQGERAAFIGKHRLVVQAYRRQVRGCRLTAGDEGVGHLAVLAEELQVTVAGFIGTGCGRLNGREKYVQAWA